MKIVVFALLLASTLGRNVPDQQSPIINRITHYGYPAEAVSVTTEDGYILKLIRIPHGKSNEQETSETSETSETLEENDKPAVFIMHGFMSSAEDFVYGGPSQGLAFQMADQGFDVYLGNARGSAYGQNHTSLNPEKDVVFWRYSFQDIGTKDLPALIDKALSMSQQSKINYIGHMEGAAAFYVLASEKPEYNNKIQKAVSLGPIAFMKNSNHQILQKIIENYKSQGWIIKNLGASIFKPSSQVVQDVQSKCSKAQNEERICENVYFLYNGYNSNKFNQTTVKQALARVPSGGSVREVIHFAQLKESGRFRSYSHDLQDSEPHDFDLSKVSAPVAIFYAPNDAQSQAEDIQTLIEKLPNVYKQQEVVAFTNNLDFIYANNVAFINNDVINALKAKNEKNVFT